MNLAAFLSKNAMTQDEFAKSVGVTQARIAQLLAGEQPSFKLAKAIAAKTGGKVPLSAWGNEKQAA